MVIYFWIYLGMTIVNRNYEPSCITLSDCNALSGKKTFCCLKSLALTCFFFQLFETFLYTHEHGPHRPHGFQVRRSCRSQVMRMDCEGAEYELLRLECGIHPAIKLPFVDGLHHHEFWWVIGHGYHGSQAPHYYPLQRCVWDHLYKKLIYIYNIYYIYINR